MRVAPSVSHSHPVPHRDPSRARPEVQFHAGNSRWFDRSNEAKLAYPYWDTHGRTYVTYKCCESTSCNAKVNDWSAWISVRVGAKPIECEGGRRWIPLWLTLVSSARSKFYSRAVWSHEHDVMSVPPLGTPCTKSGCRWDPYTLGSCSWIRYSSTQPRHTWTDPAKIWVPR